jgi:hypothetical protein
MTDKTGYGFLPLFSQNSSEQAGPYSGDFLPLGNVGVSNAVQHLHNAIVGVVLKSHDTQSLAKTLAPRIRTQSHQSRNDLVADLHADLTRRGVQHTQVTSADIYELDGQHAKNIKVWTEASSIKDAKRNVGRVSSVAGFTGYNKLKSPCSQIDGNLIKAQHRGKDKVHAVSFRRVPITRANVGPSLLHSRNHS